MPEILTPPDEVELDEQGYRGEEEELLQAEGARKIVPIDPWALASLLLQHLSNTFTAAAYDFACFLFLIEIFKDTLVPASLVGLFSKLTSLVLSGYVGGLVDVSPRLGFVRRIIWVDKGSHVCSYGLFIVLFGPLATQAQAAFHGQASIMYNFATWFILVATIVFSSFLGLANTAMTVAIERDWVTSIAQGDSNTLTLLNTYIRRIDLLSKLLAPFLVSLLTTFTSYTTTCIKLLGLAVFTFGAEYFWIQMVYSHFPTLSENNADEVTETSLQISLWGSSNPRTSWSLYDVESWVKKEVDTWRDFSRMPIFATSIAIAAIYLTTLSYDGTLIAYIKVVRGWDDWFIAAMRGVCIVTGLLGTLVMPRLESRIGLERAGAWSIWFEVTCLIPVVLAFFYGSGSYGEHGAAWNSILLFGGIALSRIGLWSFDLCQLKELQLALESHPRRNRLTALQIALQNLFDLLKYVLTLAASSPREFKWTALVSWLAVVMGAMSYAVYLRSVRGHLIHLEWFRKIL